jgi:tetratricopeptide (TPR) repeat protein
MRVTRKVSVNIILCCQIILFFGCTNLPASIDSHFNGVIEPYDNKELAKVIEEYKLALRKNPKDIFALYNLIVFYQDQGKNDKAIEIYQDVLKQIEDTSSRMYLVSIRYSQRKREEAFEQLKTSAKKNRTWHTPLAI